MARNNYADAMSKAYQSREAVAEPQVSNTEPLEEEKQTTKPEPLKAGLIVTKKKVRKGLQKSFYIREDTYEKLKLVAEDNNKSISDALQEILDQIL